MLEPCDLRGLEEEDGEGLGSTGLCRDQQGLVRRHQWFLNLAAHLDPGRGFYLFIYLC